MNYVKPFYSNGAVDRAANELLNSIRGSAEYAEHLKVINQWRSSHLWPLEKVRHTLKNRSYRVDQAAVVVQRLKRLASIENKLIRLEGTRISGMQDIGGCRSIVKDIDCVNRIVGIYEEAKERNPENRSVLISTPRDYIAYPKETGYRGVHLIIKYQSDGTDTKTWNGRKIEIQLRTKLQHSWATTLESVSTVLGQQLKANLGDPDWLRFFALASGVFAVREEAPPIPGLPTGMELYQETLQYWNKLNVRSVLFGCGIIGSQQETDFVGQSLFVLHMDATERKIHIYSFEQDELIKANEKYNDLEKRYSDRADVDIVLVKAEDIRELRLGYPNYWADTGVFTQILQDELEKNLDLELE